METVKRDEVNDVTHAQLTASGFEGLLQKAKQQWDANKEDALAKGEVRKAERNFDLTKSAVDADKWHDFLVRERL